MPFKVCQALSLACAKRDGYRCVMCWPGNGRREVQAHHVLPRSQGGADELGNLISLCAEHHGQMDGGKWKLYRAQFEAHIRDVEQRRPLVVVPRC